jgi:DNA-binding MarR family transcriptional regulator
MTSAKLAKRTNTRPHNITTLADRMKKDGLITTERSEVDKRLVIIRLTDKGQSVIDKALPLAQEVISGITSSISEQDLVTSEKVLTMVTQNIYRYNGSSK